MQDKHAVKSNEWGYISIDGKPVFVQVIETYYCHGAPVSRVVTDGATVWETHEPIYPDMTHFWGHWFVSQ